MKPGGKCLLCELQGFWAVMMVEQDRKYFLCSCIIDMKFQTCDLEMGILGEKASFSARSDKTDLVSALLITHLQIVILERRNFALFIC